MGWRLSLVPSWGRLCVFSLILRSFFFFLSHCMLKKRAQKPRLEGFFVLCLWVWIRLLVWGKGGIMVCLCERRGAADKPFVLMAGW